MHLIIHHLSGRSPCLIHHRSVLGGHKKKPALFKDHPFTQKPPGRGGGDTSITACMRNAAALIYSKAKSHHLATITK